ncbi:hypothetical protein [Stenotrophomonas acidaminiphila]|uniref:hypothetical protein n=1 Tax=Stenotrophomonas acidaminiphila TaxID=128780 RepID=UPI0028ADF2E5|nr:hypothetical protein [Stenotrophomonas acidaminiphila]
MVKLNVGERMYIAGSDQGATITTHSIAKQETIPQQSGFEAHGHRQGPVPSCLMGIFLRRQRD